MTTETSMRSFQVMFLFHDPTGLLELLQVLHPDAERLPGDGVEDLRDPQADAAFVRQTLEEIFRDPDPFVPLFEHGQPQVPVLQPLDLLVEPGEMLAPDQ